MNTGEAIRRIEDHIDHHRIAEYPHMKLSEALNMAITALREKEERRWISDFELCADTAELAKTLRCIDNNGYTMVTATQDASGTYTVFFRRPVRE